MSDSEGDFSDELLELAGASEKKRKSSKSAKRRKAEASVDSDKEDSYESEEDDANPYPLEGKFVDEADRHKLMDLPEVEREEILSQRMEEMQRLQDKRNLEQMHQAQRGEAADNVSKAAKRSHAVRGATKEKSRKLDELKAKRRAKDEKKRAKAHSPKRDRSSSPMDMEMSDEDEEDGQISKIEQNEERERRLLDKLQPEEDPIASYNDMNNCLLTRDNLAKYAHRTWFEDYVKGGWVRFLIGDYQGVNIYRACEVTGVGTALKPYNIDSKTFDQQIELKHGQAVRLFTMERVSNHPITSGEYERLVTTCKTEKVKLPTRRVLEKKWAQMKKLDAIPVTEADVSQMLAKRQALQPGSKVAGPSLSIERSKVMQELNLARRRRDQEEVAILEEKLKQITEELNASNPASSEAVVDPLALVNERNRKANLEAVRRLEAENIERKRQRKAALNGGRPGTPSDLAARLKFLPKHLDDSRNASPKGSPLLNPTTGADSQNIATRSVSPLPPAAMGNGSDAKGSAQKRTFDAMMSSQVEVDLGDF